MRFGEIDGTGGRACVTITTMDPDAPPSRADIPAWLRPEVVEVVPAPWGFTNRTMMLTTRSGERVVLQRYRNRDDARRRARVTASLEAEATRMRVPIPHIRRLGLDDPTPWVLYDALPGEPVAASIVAGADAEELEPLAAEMGAMLLRFRSLPQDAVADDLTWAAPSELASAARQWVRRLGALPADVIDAIEGAIEAVPDLFAGRDVVMSHGDYTPVNLLSCEGRITGVLDLEWARLADPLFDAAWWLWGADFFDPSQLGPAISAFLAAVGVDPSDSDDRARIRALQMLRMTEYLTTPRAPPERNAGIVRNRLSMLV